MRKRRVSAGYLCGLVFAAGSVLPGCDTAKSLIQRVTGGAETAASVSAVPSVPPPTLDVVPSTPSVIPSVAAQLPLAQLAASNEVKIKRFEDETKLDKAPAKITAEKVEVREDPTPTSVVIATLARDAELVAMAQRGDQTLASFRNPAKPDEILMGWMATPGVEVAAAASSSAASSTPPPAESAAPPAPKVDGPDKDKGKGNDKDKGKEDGPDKDKGKGNDKDKSPVKDKEKDKGSDKGKEPDKGKDKGTDKDKGSGDKGDDKSDPKKTKKKKQKGETL